MPSSGSVKGEALRQFLTWYVSTFDEHRLDAIVRAMPPELSSCFEPGKPHLGVVSSSWYPAASFHHLIEDMLAGYGPEERDRLAREAAHATIEATLRGVYKFLFETMMTPDRYAARAQKLFSRFYDTGTMAKVKTGPRSHRSEIRGWTSHHPVLCEVLRYTGEPVYAALGCKNVKTRRISCVSSGDAFCSYELSWT
jgi:hypothetical protein